MIFCALKGDKQAVAAAMYLGKRPDSETRFIENGQMLIPIAVFLYTDKVARFKNNLRILRSPKPLSPEQRRAQEARDERAGFVIPRQALGPAKAVIALHPEPKSLENYRHALEQLFWTLTGQIHNPERHQKVKELRKRRRSQYERERLSERCGWFVPAML